VVQTGVVFAEHLAALGSGVAHSIKGRTRRNLRFPDELTYAPNEDIPAAIPSLIDAAVAVLDADRDTSRRYLLRASAILRAKPRRMHAVSTRRSESRGGLLAWQLNRIVDYIETHLTDKITGKDLASLIDVSAGRLFRAFKISVGVTPRHYVTTRRVERVCTMLITTRTPLAQLALACGFCDQAHLSKLFRRTIGMPPSAWRCAMTVRYAGPDACGKDLRADGESSGVFDG
jgi:AraC family transcriptional regulator